MMRALLPLLLTYMADFDHPQMYLDQNFGLTRRYDDWMFPQWPSVFKNPALEVFDRTWGELLRPQGSSIVNIEKDKFKFVLDVQNFKPEEIKVKTVGRVVVVEAKHEENKDDKKLSKLHFVKKLYVPEQGDLGKIKSTISSDGILIVTVPLKTLPEEEENLIPIEQTGKPAVEEKPSKPEETTEKDTEEVTVETAPEK